MKKLLIFILLGIFLISLVPAESCGVYFTYTHCSNCEDTDPLVLGNWPSEDRVVIEYVFSSWTGENAQLLGEYASKFKTQAAVPYLLLEDNSYLGRIDVPNAIDDFKGDIKCQLLNKQVEFDKLDFNELPGKPKIWANNRMLVRTEPTSLDSDFLRSLLFDDLGEVLNQEKYEYREIEAEPAPISGGEIEFDKAFEFDGWILKLKDIGDVPEQPSDKIGNKTINLPIIGSLNLQESSITFLAILIGLADGFNPCAFFILTFLLAAMIYAASEVESKGDKRKRILIVGSIFVFFSGLVYFLFMSLWLNVFLFAKEIILLTTVAGCIAVFAGIINIKDYFAFQKGISLTLPKSQKGRFMQKVEKLTHVNKLPALIIGTVVIAATVNLYELLCTVGFPMVYLGALASRELSRLGYYLHILLYNVFYVIPLIVIVSIFAYTLGRKQFGKKNVQRLKLISGFMVLFLGLILIFQPNLLEKLIVSFSLLAGAVILGLLVMYIREFRK
ncbi:MAG: hypothetical protein ACP5D2_03055 [Candidatus Nanoarchaeia archaeon]